MWYVIEERHQSGVWQADKAWGYKTHSQAVEASQRRQSLFGSTPGLRIRVSKEKPQNLKWE